MAISVRRKKEYAASKIAVTKALGNSDVADWNMDSIMKRDIRVSDEIMSILNRWNNEYLNVPAKTAKADEPSEEDLARIEEFKKRDGFSKLLIRRGTYRKRIN